MRLGIDRPGGWAAWLMAAVMLLLAPGGAQADKPGGAWMGEHGSGPVKVSIQLKWRHQFQFAGYYAALAKGFYRDAGLDVTLIEGAPGRNAAEQVSNGLADFGIGSSSLIVSHAHGQDIVVVAPVFQNSPFVVIARRKPGLHAMSDLAGRNVMIGADPAEMSAFLSRAGVERSSLTIVPHGGDALPLRGSDVDAVTAYSTTEVFDLIRAQVPFQVFNPRDVGLDFYGDTLFTSGRLARERPEVVRAFREASLAGWKYALAHTDEIIDLIQAEHAPHIDRRRLEFEAEQTRRLMLAGVVDQIGRAHV